MKDYVEVDEKKCDDVNLIKTLTLRLEELDNSIKMKDNEIRKYQTMLEQSEKKINNFTNELKLLTKS